MAKELVVRETFTEDMLETGAELLKQLETLGVEITASGWLYQEERKSWRFMIASPSVRNKGSRQLYEKILDLEDAAQEEEKVLNLQDIRAVEEKEPILSSLQQVIKNRCKKPGMRITRDVINGHYIEDSYIYCLH